MPKGVATHRLTVNALKESSESLAWVVYFQSVPSLPSWILGKSALTSVPRSLHCHYSLGFKIDAAPIYPHPHPSVTPGIVLFLQLDKSELITFAKLTLDQVNYENQKSLSSDLLCESQQIPA